MLCSNDKARELLIKGVYTERRGDRRGREEVKRKRRARASEGKGKAGGCRGSPKTRKEVYSKLINILKQRMSYII